jgi:hypothetical protein
MGGPPALLVIGGGIDVAVAFSTVVSTQVEGA